MGENNAYKAALSKAMALCSRREYCTSDIHEKIDSWGVNSDDNTRIIKVLLKENFINENRFALAYVRDKFNFNKWGKIKIRNHLFFKKIPDNVVDKAILTIDNKTYTETLRELISSHKRVTKAKDQYEMKAKLIRYGLSKGYESSLIHDILNEKE